MKKQFVLVAILAAIGMLIAGHLALATTIGTNVSTVAITASGAITLQSTLTLDELSSFKNVTISGTLTVTGTSTFNGLVTATSTDIFATTTRAALRVRQSSSGDIINVFDGSTEVFTILDGGYVGVGSSTPYSILSVSTASQSATALLTVASTTGEVLFEVLANGEINLDISVGGVTYIVAAADSQNKGKADYIADGTADEVEIKAAIDALPNTGGRVILLEGTYYINSQILFDDTVNNDYVTLEGQGLGTLLKVPDGHASTMSVIKAYGSGRKLLGINVKNLRIDGNRSNVTGSYYVGVNFATVASSTIDGVYLSNGKGSGGDGYGFMIADSKDVTIRNSSGLDWNYEPMEIRNSQKVSITGNRLDFRLELYDNNKYVSITNNHFSNLKISAGTDTGTNSYINGLDISGNYFYTTSTAINAAIHLIRSNNSKITSNYISSVTTGISVAVNNSHTQIDGNAILANGPITVVGATNYGIISNNKLKSIIAVFGHAINLSSSPGPSHWKISDNMITGNSATNGITVNPATDIIVEGNYITDCGLVGIKVVSGTSIQVLQNNYYNNATNLTDAGTATFIINNVSGKMGIGTTTPAMELDVNGRIRTQPAASATCNNTAKGAIYYDSDDDHFYGCDGSAWNQLDN